MNIEDFNFKLPEELIAQSPLEKRDESKLMVVSSTTEDIKMNHFYNIVEEIPSNSVLVLNETKVIPARIFGIKEMTNAKIELLLLKEVDKDVWEAIIKPSKRIKVGDVINCSNLLKLECLKSYNEGIKLFKLTYDGILIEVLEEIGTLPLPPYIHEKLNDKNRYQTVYANQLGSAAAPTAGLHFTPEILERLIRRNIEVIKVTLHVGLGTFKPVKVDKIEEHVMHSEKYYISDDAATRLNEAKRLKKNIIAVGTTSIRTLESNFNNGKFTAGEFNTNIFIYPGYKFKVVDQLITNFHLPKSTLLMLVSALTSTKLMQRAYNLAIENKFRFFSFGDAMYIK